MANPKIFDGEKNRTMTDAEYEQWQTDNAEKQAQIETLKAKAVAKANALAKLGLTADEAAALFG